MNIYACNNSIASVSASLGFHVCSVPTNQSLIVPVYPEKKSTVGHCHGVYTTQNWCPPKGCIVPHLLSMSRVYIWVQMSSTSAQFDKFCSHQVN